MELGLAGKVALITGSSRGIGRGIAVTLAAAGCDVVLHGRDQAALAEVAAEVGKFGRKATVEANDLSKEGSPAALVAAVKRAGGRLDILVNNAGATKRGDFRDLTDADWKDGFELKFFAHVRLAREAWPLLKASGGSLITIAGIGGKEPEAEFGIGSSVNAACVAWTKALADVGKKEGVQVNAINPGRVETERLWRRIRERVKTSGLDEAKVRSEFQDEFGITRFGRTDDIASLIAFIASPHGRWLHGATIDMDGGEVRGV
jgi:NAD(P)-dependent dehydrogenase (short-subunit alcohol dehydrogenase family)